MSRRNTTFFEGSGGGEVRNWAHLFLFSFPSPPPYLNFNPLLFLPFLPPVSEPQSAARERERERRRRLF